MEHIADPTDGTPNEGVRSSAGQVVDALGDTTLFAYRVALITRPDGTQTLYRGAYDVGQAKSELGFVEKQTGEPAGGSDGSLRWESADRVKNIFVLAMGCGFEILHEGTFMFRRDATAAELSERLSEIENRI